MLAQIEALPRPRQRNQAMALTVEVMRCPALSGYSVGHQDIPRIAHQHDHFSLFVFGLIRFQFLVVLAAAVAGIFVGVYLIWSETELF